MPRVRPRRGQHRTRVPAAPMAPSLAGLGQRRSCGDGGAGDSGASGRGASGRGAGGGGAGDGGSGGRLLFRPELGAGAHVGPAGRYDRMRYEAEILAFVLASVATLQR